LFLNLVRERGGPIAADGSMEFDRLRRGTLRVGLGYLLTFPRDLSRDWFYLLFDGVLLLSDALWLKEIFRLFFDPELGEVWLINPVASL